MKRHSYMAAEPREKSLYLIWNLPLDPAPCLPKTPLIIKQQRIIGRLWTGASHFQALPPPHIASAAIFFYSSFRKRDVFSENITNILTAIQMSGTLRFVTITMKFTQGETMAKKNNDSRNHKEALFNDFFISAYRAMHSLEISFEVTGVVKQIFGSEDFIETDPDDSKAAREKLRDSTAWAALNRLYDYAIHGIEDGNEDSPSIVIDGSNIIKLCTTEDNWPSDEWESIVAMGDGRHALDDGQAFDIYKVALLSNVDIRTVKNAVSAGDLVAFKSSVGARTLVENASARRWLLGKKGFKPTVMQNDTAHEELVKVDTPADFGLFLAAQKKRIGLGQADDKLVPRHPCVKPDTLVELESGIFNLPLDAVLPVADFYQLHRKEFLECVMRVFFPDELHMLSASEENE